MAYNLWTRGQVILVILLVASLGYSMLFKFVTSELFRFSGNHISTFPEHWRSRCLPLRAVHLRYIRTPSSYFHWCIYHVYRHHHSDCFPVCWNVHWGSVRASGFEKHTFLTCYLFSFLIGFGVTFAGDCQSYLQVNRLTELHILANAAPLLVTEIAYPTHRSPLTSTYNSLWYSGAIMWVSFVFFFVLRFLTCINSAAWTTFATELKLTNTWSWRIPSALQGLPAVIQVFLIYFCPESPRWLVSKGREDQALQTLAYYHADGNACVSAIWFLYS